MWLYYTLAALVLAQGLLSLRGGLRFLRFVRRETGARRELYMPFASVFVPCRGLDDGLWMNFAALFLQHYPAYELLFVTDDAEDPALAVVQHVRETLGERSVARVRTVVAGPATDEGQKVHNLRAAVKEAAPESEVFVFVDTDARPRPDWLRSLVAPLADEATGAATGYRWFFPVRGGFASHLLSVWNASIASALGENTRRNFCWGGSTAIRRETFERLNVEEAWRGALSDDYALTGVLQRAGLPVRFVPDCLTPSFEDATARRLFEFTTRQIKITRVYAPDLWRIVLISNLLFVVVFYGGVILAAARAALGLRFAWTLAVVGTIFLLGTWKSFFRLRAVALVLGDHHAHLRRGLWAHLLLWPVSSALFLANALAALLSRRIAWRGITYRLKSPRETEIIRAEPFDGAHEASAAASDASDSA